MAADFISTNENHLKIVKDMGKTPTRQLELNMFDFFTFQGITIISLADGRVQLMHSFSNVSISACL